MRQNDFEAPPAIRIAEVAVPTLPLPPPEDPLLLDAFLDWVASVPRDARDTVREAIAGLRDHAGVLDVLTRAALELPVVDTGRHLMLLAVLGELRAPASADTLERFVWLSDEDVFGAQAARGPCDFSPAGGLQSRAAEMLVWVLGTGGEDRVLQIIREHPSTSVRVAAIDAWLYQRDDTADALATLSDLVSPEDVWAVGLPRWTADGDPVSFQQRVTTHAERFGDDVELPARTWGNPDVR